MNQELVERVLNCPSLPTLPAIAVRVIELTQKADVSLEELAQTIHNDQGLTAKVLRTVNSSFYGLRQRCGTINQALVILGLSAVKSLALGFSLISSLAPGAKDEFDYVAYWRRGLYTAVASRIIAREAKATFVDEAFFGGLLQDVGMMAMYRGIGEKYLGVVRAANADHRSLVKLELQEFEVQHPDLGAMLAMRWRLPEELVVAVKYHERPTAAPEKFAGLARCVALGGMVHDALTDANPVPAVKRVHARARQWFDLSASPAQDVIRRTAEAVKQMSQLFRLDTGRYADADAIMKKAEEELIETGAREYAAAAAGSFGRLLTDSDTVDPLTGALSRPAVMQSAESAFEAARTASRNLTLLRIAVDSLGALAEGHGPDGADAALAELAALLQEQLSPLGGTVGRWDGSSFLVIVPGLDRACASKIADECRRSVESNSRRWRARPDGEPISCTASVGAVSIEPSKSGAFAKVGQVLAAASRAMDAAASVGGNCARMFVPKMAA